jgi:hypothetical protein
MSWFRNEWFAAPQYASEWFGPVAVEPPTPPPSGGVGGGGTRVRFPRLPGMKPRDRRRRHEEDLLVVIL